MCGASVLVLWTLDFTTAGFDETSNSASLSYELPVTQGANPTRVRAYASYGNFVASDVGLSALQFRGDSTMVGGEIIQPLWQLHELFLDGVVGFRYEHERVDNLGTATKGTGDFSQPYVGLRLERTTPESSLVGGAELIGTIGSSSQESLDNLGRLGVDRNTINLQGHISYSFYLEPLLDSANYAAQKSTLAHEIYIAGRAQEAFDYRMVPSMQDTIGGLYSVRGYPESVSAGDSIIVGTAEYRLHIPRLFDVSPPGRDILGKPFRYAPQQAYGRPDWDLVAKAFVDVGQTYLNNRIAGESNQSLVGTGVGLEFLYKQYLSIRADWGVAVQPIEDESSGESVKGGSNRFHLVFTLSY
jgi:hemolysin activation/secretion protein